MALKLQSYINDLTVIKSDFYPNGVHYFCLFLVHPFHLKLCSAIFVLVTLLFLFFSLPLLASMSVSCYSCWCFSIADYRRRKGARRPDGRRAPRSAWRAAYRSSSPGWSWDKTCDDCASTAAAKARINSRFSASVRAENNSRIWSSRSVWWHHMYSLLTRALSSYWYRGKL